MVTSESLQDESASWCYQCHSLSLPFFLPIIWTFHCLFTLVKPIHSLPVLFKVLGNIVEGKKVETKAIGANDALDCLWNLNIPSIPDPSTSMDDLVFHYMSSHEWLIETPLIFHDTVPGAARYSSCLCWCAVPKPQGSTAFSSATVPFCGGGAWGRVTQLRTHNGRERARAKKILVWAHITSCFTSWIKASAS